MSIEDYAIASVATLLHLVKLAGVAVILGYALIVFSEAINLTFARGKEL
jgi:hypothetical protein